MSLFLVLFLTLVPFAIVSTGYRMIGEYEGRTGKESPLWIKVVLGVIMGILVIHYVPWMLPSDGITS